MNTINAVRFQIEIESQILIGFEGKFKIQDMLFADLCRTEISTVEMLALKRKAQRKLGNQYMITITIFECDKNHLHSVLCSYRFIKELSSVKGSIMSEDDTYSSFETCDVKDIEEKIKTLIVFANKHFKENIKKDNSEIECPCCKGKKTQTVKAFVVDGKGPVKGKFGYGYWEKPVIMDCHVCGGVGSITKEKQKAIDEEKKLWCKCGAKHGSAYVPDGCGVIHKHHYICNDCQKITQIG